MTATCTTTDLFGNKEKSDAIFSECGKYRYVLMRLWDHNKPNIMFIGLNPSTANATTDDPTIRRVKSFAKEWGYGGLYMTNLFGWVSAYPEELLKCSDPIGDNNDYLITTKGFCEQVVFAWGNFKEAEKRAKEVIEMFPGSMCLGKNANGTPKHPLYLSKTTTLKPFNQ